jgi:hypothetical protein
VRYEEGGLVNDSKKARDKFGSLALANLLASARKDSIL